MVTDYTVNPYRYIYDKYTYVQYIVIYSIRVFFSTLFLSSLNAMYILNVVFSSHRTSVDVFIY